MAPHNAFWSEFFYGPHIIGGKMIQKFISIIVMLVCVSSASAKTLLVSDIDDTIKVSHIQSFFASLASAFQSGPSFRGMAEVYHMAIESSDTDVVYVTNAPEGLMKHSHLNFLEVNGFPAGDVFFWSEGEKEHHKFNAISTLLQSGLYDEAILIGDNGEKDPISYQRIEAAFPQIKIKTLIRTLYSDGTGLEKNDISFMSPAQVSLYLCRWGLLDKQKELQFRKKIHQEIQFGFDGDDEVFGADWTTEVPVIHENLCL